jgi:hypothetical protein
MQLRKINTSSYTVRLLPIWRCKTMPLGNLRVQQARDFLKAYSIGEGNQELEKRLVLEELI